MAVMRARHAKLKELTLKEWADLPDDVPGELVDGVLVEEEVASLPHEVVAYFLLRLFGWVDDRGGFVLPAGYKYGVAPKRGRIPDLSVFFPGTRHPRAADPYGTSAPDIAVEIISPTPRDARRDRIEKMAEYARFGIRWYWLIDPATRIVEIFELGPRKSYTRKTAASAGRLAVPGCRGLKLDVDKLWAQVDRVS